MKLNYKRTILVGFAFFIILTFWQAYEAIVPLMLVNKFGLNQTQSGIIMALDNILAVFLLPLFGMLSDKSKSRLGRRTPYILIGTLVAIVAFVGLTFADNAQLTKVFQEKNPQQFQEMLFDEDISIKNLEKDSDDVSIRDYAAHIKYNKSFSELDESEKNSLKSWFATINEKTYYYFDGSNYLLIEEGQKEPGDLVKCNAYTNMVTPAINLYARRITTENPVPLVFFIAILLVVLVAMASFRSPAVALMPDVTIKPLRSQGNAIINLMGTLGGMLVLVLGMIFKTGSSAKQTGSFTWYVLAVCGLMAIGLVIFMCFVKEKKWAKEMEEQSIALGIEEGATETDNKDKETIIEEPKKLSKGKLVSLILILASVALWYTGYNAASSKYSLYATNILHKDYNMTLLVAQAAAIIFYMPAGWVSSKIGRKNSILLGVAILTLAFLGISFFTSETPAIFINILFSLGGIGWATINVNSFPMVVELAEGNNVGKYTGYYYTASMAAQIVTPILSGFIMDWFGSMKPLFFYSTIFIAMAFFTMLFVRYGDSVKLEKKAKKENDK